MSVTLTGCVIVLAGILLSGPFFLVWDGRERRRLRQIALATALAGANSSETAEQSIRRERVRHAWLRNLVRISLLYDPAFDEAFSLPVPLTFLLALLTGAIAGLLSAHFMATPLAVLDGTVTAGMACRGMFGWQRNRYTMRLRKQLPDALQFVVAAVRAGFPVLEALRGITREAPQPTRQLFARALDEVALGNSVQTALLRLYYRTRVAEYAIFAVTLGVQTKTGGHLAETIQMLAETVRERISIAARAKALAGEGTVSATILSVLPIITGIALSLIQPGYLDPLFKDPRGQRLFVLAVGALLAGIWMMRRMIAGVVKE